MDEMKECIYRKEATEFIDKCLEHEEKLQSVERETLIAVKKYLDSIPAADVQHVVLCRDCEWWTKQKASLQGRCELLQMYPTGTWFCAYGEKRLDDETT